jgi:hypothetical protein
VKKEPKFDTSQLVIRDLANTKRLADLEIGCGDRI